MIFSRRQKAETIRQPWRRKSRTRTVCAWLYWSPAAFQWRSYNKTEEERFN